MLETASLLCFYEGFALLYAASPRRFPAPGWRLTPSLIRVLQLSAGLALGLGIWLWRQADNATAALLIAPVALGVVATGFVLLAPLAPRVLWGLALLGPPLVLLLSLIGSMHG